MLAMQFILNYGFNKLKLHKISLGVFSNNLPAIKLYKKIGFKTEGKFRDECLRRGKYLDMLSMAKFNKI